MYLILVCAFCLMAPTGSYAQEPPFKLRIKSGEGNGQCGISTDALDEAEEQVRTLFRPEVGTPQNPAASCTSLPQDSPSGYYWIEGTQGNPNSQVYCDMNRTQSCSCSSTGGWMRVANLNMTDPSQECPSGFRNVSSPRRSCGRPESVRGCISTTFPVNGVEYSRVCGRVIGIQFATPDAFQPYYNDRTMTLDGVYVEGVSLTHSSPQRTHIWTFAAAVDEQFSNWLVCPCTRPDLTYTGIVPPFVGQDYFCETGTRGTGVIGQYEFVFFPNDPLWDGQGCGGASTCCNHPLFFCKQLPQPTRDDIELRLCGPSPIANEDTPLEVVEIYVQ